MAYRIERDEPLGDAVRRIIHEQIDHALDDIHNASGETDRAVHEVRKRCKRIRAALRVARDELGESYSEENAWYRDTARRISELRDRTALIETLDKWAEQQDAADEQTAQIREQLLQQKEAFVAEQPDPNETLARVADELSRAKQRIALWKLSLESFDSIRPSLGRVYRRGRRAIPHAYKLRSVEAFHQWRKRAKYYRYHLQLQESVWPAFFEMYRSEFHHLSNYLGDDHDLSMLLQNVQQRPAEFASDRVAPVVIAIEHHRDDLRRQAHRLGKRLYAERPTDHLNRLAAYWDAD